MPPAFVLATLLRYQKVLSLPTAYAQAKRLALAQKSDFLLTEAIQGMDSKRNTSIRADMKRALALLGEDAHEATGLLAVQRRRSAW